MPKVYLLATGINKFECVDKPQEATADAKEAMDLTWKQFECAELEQAPKRLSNANLVGTSAWNHKGGLGMSKVLIGLAVICLAGCAPQQNVNSNAALEAKVADLEKAVDDLKPGLGEIMGVIQQHHAKLYYAGTKANWPLADYELSEIQESLDDAMKFYPKFKDVPVPLTELIPTMTKASLAQVRAAIEQKNGKSFAQSFGALSASCSNCHEAANHPFVRIQAPSDAMFSNQKFAP